MRYGEKEIPDRVVGAPAAGDDRGGTGAVRVRQQRDHCHHLHPDADPPGHRTFSSDAPFYCISHPSGG